MNFGHAEVRQLVGTIFESMLGWPVEEARPLALPAGNKGYLTGTVQITGAWEGAVEVICAEPLARQLAAVLFNMDEADMSAELVHDALGELANITGGNLKALLPEPCYLSLPTVADGKDYGVRVLQSKPVLQSDFRCQDLPLQVAILERDQNPSRPLSRF